MIQGRGGHLTKYLTSKEAAAYLRISLTTLHVWASDPEKMRILNPSRVTCRKVLYDRANLDRLISHFQQFADPPPLGLSQTRIPPIEAVTAPIPMETWAKRRGAYCEKLGIKDGVRPGASPRPIRKAATHRRTAHPRN